MRVLGYIAILTLFSCHQKGQETLKQPIDTLKPYQKYCLDMLTKVTSNNVGYKLSDSFQLWSDDYVNKRWKSFYITRTVNDGFYSYIFWRKSNDTFIMYKEAQSSKIGFVSDSLYDVNGDNFKDFVITDNSMNGQCQPLFTQLFCFDINKDEFREVEEINSLPNVRFHPKDKTLTGEWECKMTKDVYKFKWADTFKLDTVYFRTLQL